MGANSCALRAGEEADDTDDAVSNKTLVVRRARFCRWVFFNKFPPPPLPNPALLQIEFHLWWGLYTRPLCVCVCVCVCVRARCLCASVRACVCVIVCMCAPGLMRTVGFECPQGLFMIAWRSVCVSQCAVCWSLNSSDVCTQCVWERERERVRACARARVCVCVHAHELACVRERERERWFHVWRQSVWLRAARLAQLY